jgi:microcin C transport system substrate-binding protein
MKNGLVFVVIDLHAASTKRHWGHVMQSGLFKVFAVTALLATASISSHAAPDVWEHGTAITGTPRLAEGFVNFPYVNPTAPKGGIARQGVAGSFDSFNCYTIKGEAAPNIAIIYDTLMTPSLDEEDISAQYGLLAEATKYPADLSSVSFRLNANAKWHDGVAVSVDDVIWSFEKLKEINPQLGFYYQDVAKAEKTGEREVTFTFSVKGNRELPHIMGQMVVLPKHWWEGKDASGKQRDISQPTLEPTLGSSAYKIGKFESGRYVEYNRVADYWAKDLNSKIGTDNFDVLRYDLYGEESVMLEAFKGDGFDYRFERSSKNWATGYTALPALEKGLVIKEEFLGRASGRMQAFVPNLRRDKFKDPRVRRALNLAYDFESMNKTTFYGLYQRIDSYFAGTELASSGLPEGKELEILNEVKDLVPPQVFETPYANPVGGDLAKMRENYREAVRLLKEAGWSFKGNTLTNEKTGEPFVIELIDDSDLTARFVLPYAESLKKIGITLNFRVLDSSSMVERERKFDYDMVTSVWGQSLSPGNEQREYWGSAASKRDGSRNLAGIADPAVDKLIEKVVFAADRETLIAAVHALDRVMLANNYMVPQWYSQKDFYVYWNRFGRPDRLPLYSFGFPSVWWLDQAKADHIAKTK